MNPRYPTRQKTGPKRVELPAPHFIPDESDSTPLKAPKPSIPKGAPAGTVWFGGPIAWFSITLRIIGDDLDPDEMTTLLGCQPDDAQRKGEPILRDDGSVMRTARTGAWRLYLKPDETDEWDCAEAMMLLLRRLPSRAGLWKRLARKYQIDFFVGLSMASRNKGFELPTEIMKYLGDRGINAGFDIYCEADKEADPVSPKSQSRSPRRAIPKGRKKNLH